MTKTQIRKPALVRVVWTGQSLNVIPPYPDDAVTQTMQGSGIPYANLGISGFGWYDLINDSTHMTLLEANARNASGTYDVLVLNGGQGDVLNASPSGQQTGAVCYTRMGTYADTARAFGYDYIVGCTLPAMGPNMLGSGRPIPSEQTAIDNLKSLVLADAGNHFDTVVDLDTPPLDDATNTTYFNVDRLHLYPAGAKALGIKVMVAIQDFIETIT